MDRSLGNEAVRHWCPGHTKMGRKENEASGSNNDNYVLQPVRSVSRLKAVDDLLCTEPTYLAKASQSHPNSKPKLKPSALIKDQVQPARQPDTALDDAALHDLGRALVVITTSASTNLGAVKLVSRNLHDVVADLLIAVLGPRGSRALGALPVGRQPVVPQPPADVPAVAALVDLGGEVVGPAQKVGVGDVGGAGGRGDAQHGVGDRGVPRRVQVGLVAVEEDGHVVGALAESFGVQGLGDVTEKL